MLLNHVDIMEQVMFMIIVQDYFFSISATRGVNDKTLWFDVAYRTLLYYEFRCNYNLPCDAELFYFCIILCYLNRLHD